MKICDLLKRQCNNKNIAIIQNGRNLSYKEWNILSQNLADKINMVNANTNVILLLPNSIEYAIAYFAVVFSDRVVVPMNYDSKSFEVEKLITYCESSLIITNSGYPYLDLIDNSNIYLIDTEEFIAKGTALKEYNHVKEDVFLMLQTSGSVDSPKRVMLTNEGVIENIISNNLSLSLTQNEIVLVVLPMVFGYCNTSQFLTSVFLASKMIIFDKPLTPSNFFNEVLKHKVTYSTLVPSVMYTFLNPSVKDKYKDVILKCLCFGGAKPLEDKILSLIESYPNIGFFQTYGQTECSPRLTTLIPEDAVSKIHSVGKAIPNVSITIRDSKGNILPDKAEGEICVFGKNVMAGYYKNSKLTEQTIVDGWLHTGDIGYTDDDYIYILGRKKNLIIYNGINIFPEEIESVLCMHPKITDSRVYGIKNPNCGELLAASIVVSGSVSIYEIKCFCKERLIDYKVPVQFDIVDKIDKTYNGKIRR